MRYKYTKKHNLRKFADEDNKITIKSDDNPKVYFVEKFIGYSNTVEPKEEPEIDFIIFYNSELIQKLDAIRKIKTDATFDHVPNVKGVYQLLTVLVEIENKERIGK